MCWGLFIFPGFSSSKMNVIHPVFCPINVRVGWSLSSQVAVFIFISLAHVKTLFSLLSTVDLTLSVRGLTVRFTIPPLLYHHDMP